MLVEEGARVVVADVNADGVGELIAALGHNYADGVTCDIRDEAQVENMVALAFRRFGRLDIAFNNAGVGGFSPIQSLALAEWERVLGTTLTGTFLCIKHEAARLIAQGQGGSIINVASINATQAAEGFAAYCSAKAGVDMLTKVGALELGRHNIRVNAIGPGLIHTPLSAGLSSVPGLEAAFAKESALGRVGEPEDIARVAVFLASDQSSLMTGQTLYVDGGATLKGYPALFDYLTPNRGTRPA